MSVLPGTRTRLRQSRVGKKDPRPRTGFDLFVLVVVLLVAALHIPFVSQAQPAYQVDLSVTDSKETGSGEIVTHVFTIRNLGTNHDIYSILLNVPDGWASLPVPQSLFIPAGETSVVFANLSVPRSAAAGAYVASLQITSQNDAEVTALVSAVTFVRTHWQFELDWVLQPHRGQPGSWLEAAVSIENVGNAPDEYIVRFEMAPNWEIDPRTETFGLMPGEYKELDVFVRIPDTASSGSTYFLTITAVSNGDPLNEKTLTITEELAPPQPELVRGSIYPEWTVSARLEVDCRQDPVLNLRGWGTIKDLGHIDLSTSISMDGIGKPSLWFETDNWSVYVDGGSIASKFTGISGDPLIGGRIGESGMWRALWDEDARGGVGLWITDCSSTRISFGTDLATDLHFEEVDWTCDFTQVLTGTFFLNQASQQTDAGTAWGIGGSLTLEDCGIWDFDADYLEISEDYPSQAPRKSFGVSSSHRGCQPIFDVDYDHTITYGGTAPNDYEIVSRAVNVSLEPFAAEILSLGVDAGVSWRVSDDNPQSVDEYGESFGLRLAGASPFVWSLSGTMLQRSIDKITGDETFSQDLAFSSSFELGSLLLSPGFSASLLDDGSDVDLSSSGLFQVQSLTGNPGVQVSLSASEGSGTLEAELTWDLANGGQVTWLWEVASCGETEWATSLDIVFPSFFSCCGPSKGRITGYVFVDDNSNGIHEDGEQGVEGILLRANGGEAISGSDGWFVFMPFEPGDYRLQIESLPPGLVPGITLPRRVILHAGSQIEVMIPLQRQSWIRGVIFDDENQDGVRSSGEYGIANVRVLISGGGQSLWVITDSSGRFMARLPAGHYTAELDETTLPERYRTTTFGRIALSLDEYGITDVAFGAYRPPRPVVVTFGPPTVSYTFNPSPPGVGELATFEAFAVSPMGDEIASIEWEFSFGDTTIIQTGAAVQFRFPEAGTWQVLVTAKDTNGLIGISQGTIPVQ